MLKRLSIIFLVPTFLFFTSCKSGQPKGGGGGEGPGGGGGGNRQPQSQPPQNPVGVPSNQQGQENPAIAAPGGGGSAVPANGDNPGVTIREPLVQDTGTQQQPPVTTQEGVGGHDGAPVVDTDTEQRSPGGRRIDGSVADEIQVLPSPSPSASPSPSPSPTASQGPIGLDDIAKKAAQAEKEAKEKEAKEAAEAKARGEERAKSKKP